MKLGDMFVYRLTAQDAETINQKRKTAADTARLIKGRGEQWSIGSQQHEGNVVKEGDIFPMMAVKKWSDNIVNGQVFLDGNDVHWVTSVSYGDRPGNYWKEEE